MKDTKMRHNKFGLAAKRFEEQMLAWAGSVSLRRDARWYSRNPGGGVPEVYLCARAPPEGLSEFLLFQDLHQFP